MGRPAGLGSWNLSSICGAFDSDCDGWNIDDAETVVGCVLGLGDGWLVRSGGPVDGFGKHAWWSGSTRRGVGVALLPADQVGEDEPWRTVDEIVQDPAVRDQRVERGWAEIEELGSRHEIDELVIVVLED